MLLEPIAAPAASPAALMFTIEELELAQVAVPVRSCVLPSLNVPVAVNCALVPLAIDGCGAPTLIDRRAAAVTVSVTLFEVIPF